MRRLFVVLVLFALVAMAVPAAAAAPPSGRIVVVVAVPDALGTDGELDQVVVTGAPVVGNVDVPLLCFLQPGDYAIQQMVIRDKSAGVHGIVAAIGTAWVPDEGPGGEWQPADGPLPAGTRFPMLHIRDCEIGGVVYRVYQGGTG